MDGLKTYIFAFLIWAVTISALYFLFHMPAVEKAFRNGRNSCEKEIDTVRIPGTPFIVYRDTSSVHSNPVSVVQIADSFYCIQSSDSIMYVSGKDTINVNARVSILINKDSSLAGENADWEINVKHRDFDRTPDTIMIFTPKYIETFVSETNWTNVGIGYLVGIITVLIGLIL